LLPSPLLRKLPGSELPPGVDRQGSALTPRFLLLLSFVPYEDHKGSARTSSKRLERFSLVPVRPSKIKSKIKSRSRSRSRSKSKSKSRKRLLRQWAKGGVNFHKPREGKPGRNGNSAKNGEGGLFSPKHCGPGGRCLRRARIISSEFWSRQFCLSAKNYLFEDAIAPTIVATAGVTGGVPPLSEFTYLTNSTCPSMYSTLQPPGTWLK